MAPFGRVAQISGRALETFGISRSAAPRSLAQPEKLLSPGNRVGHCVLPIHDDEPEG
jgi:hypothetical protein